MTLTYYIKIPEERIAVLIGTKGEVKNKLQKELNVSLNIDSKEGDVSISGDDGLKLFNAKEVIHAIGRGFNPDIAMKLVKFDYSLEIVKIDDYAKNKSDIIRLRGRVIGKEGKSRKLLEELSGCDICVYGKTVGIIGPVEKDLIARRAIEMILHGSMHASVYKFLETQRKNDKNSFETF